MKYTFVWWGDGYFVYKDGKYIGKDDQVDLVYEMVRAGLVERKQIPEDHAEALLGATDDLADMGELEDYDGELEDYDG